MIQTSVNVIDQKLGPEFDDFIIIIINNRFLY